MSEVFNTSDPADRQSLCLSFHHRSDKTEISVLDTKWIMSVIRLEEDMQGEGASYTKMNVCVCLVMCLSEGSACILRKYDVVHCVNVISSCGNRSVFCNKNKAKCLHLFSLACFIHENFWKCICIPGPDYSCFQRFLNVYVQFHLLIPMKTNFGL